MPLVSIGISFLNPGDSIKEAIKSVYCQDYQDWELILVNDGSTDNSIELVNLIRDPRVRVINDSANLGLSRRLNQISDLSRGEYLTRMDADDMMHPSRIKKQVEYLERMPEIDIVHSAAFLLNDHNNVISLIGFGKAPDPYQALKWGGFVHATVTTRKGLLIEHRYDPNFPRAEDREIYFRIIQNHGIGYIPEPLYFYRRSDVRVGAYLQGYRSERWVIRQYGPKMIGRTRTCFLWTRSIAKSVALVGLAYAHKEDLPIKHNCETASEKMKAEAYEVTRKIECQEVPGW